MTVFIADIASFQQGLVLSDLEGSCIAVEIKCTQGVTYVDPDYASWLTQARVTGLIPIAYHYIDGTDPASQAAWLKTNIQDPTLPVMLDVEAGSGNLEHVLSVVDAMAAIGLRPKLVYLPKWYWESIGSPDLAVPLNARAMGVINAAYLSAASGSALELYPGDDAAGWAPYGNVTPVMYQFTDAAVAGSRKIDMNAYKGTPEDLAAFLNVVDPSSTGSSTAQTAPVFEGRQFVYPQPGQGPNAYVMGTDVETWQQRMKQRGWTIGVDGKYGPQSAAVCRAFQQDSTTHSWPLVVDGIVGPKTWTATWLRPVSS
jgi:hypothetical protein